MALGQGGVDPAVGGVGGKGGRACVHEQPKQTKPWVGMVDLRPNVEHCRGRETVSRSRLQWLGGVGALSLKIGRHGRGFQGRAQWLLPGFRPIVLGQGGGGHERVRM